MTETFESWWERVGCRVVGDPEDYARAAWEYCHRKAPPESELSETKPKQDDAILEGVMFEVGGYGRRFEILFRFASERDYILTLHCSMSASEVALAFREIADLLEKSDGELLAEWEEGESTTQGAVIAAGKLIAGYKKTRPNA